ncbi:hypothetical protein E0L36_22170 [Streptomyces sp. AJS327]|uniref:hypothetical protein n=1 Tax=Streptomyces sp. AJS327 TaxID=2545265 RepID=UPI0015DF0005|nr:hypothetical protein [Streptomyces sp. AJS327]MBA0053484.1 hypothetical protein [Streptomyces sp. AJS327]
MNPDFLPEIGRAVRDIAAYAHRGEVTDQTLAELAEELERAVHLVRSAQGKTTPANRCSRHPGGPIDPTADNGCLLCGTANRRPARTLPEGVELGEVLRAVADDGHEAAAARYGAQAVARALAIGTRHPSKPRPGQTARKPHPEGETTR